MKARRLLIDHESRGPFFDSLRTHSYVSNCLSGRLNVYGLVVNGWDMVFMSVWTKSGGNVLLSFVPHHFVFRE